MGGRQREIYSVVYMHLASDIHIYIRWQNIIVCVWCGPPPVQSSRRRRAYMWDAENIFFPHIWRSCPCKRTVEEEKMKREEESNKRRGWGYNMKVWDKRWTKLQPPFLPSFNSYRWTDPDHEAQLYMSTQYISPCFFNLVRCMCLLFPGMWA